MTESTAVARVPLPISVAGIPQGQYDKMDEFRVALENNLPAIAAVLPPGVRPEGLASTALTALMDNPKLLDCTPVSLFRAVYKAAALGLRIGETCDIVGPLKGKAECWVRVKGVVDLAKRAGAIVWAREGYVVEGDVFEFEERSNGTHFLHRPTGGVAHPTGTNVTHIYAIIMLPNGTRVYEVWPMAKCLAHKERFAKDTKPGSAWAEHPLPMMSKSVVKAGLRFSPLSPVMMAAIGAGDEIPAGDFEVITDSQQQLAAGTLDALESLDDGEKMTLADAEAMTVRGKALRDLSSGKLADVLAWAQENDNDRLATAVEIVLGSREDERESEGAAA